MQFPLSLTPPVAAAVAGSGAGAGTFRPGLRSGLWLLFAVVLIALLSLVSRVKGSDDAGFSLYWPSAGIGLVLLARCGVWGLVATGLGVLLWAMVGMHWGLGAALWGAAASVIGPWWVWRGLRPRFEGTAEPFSNSATLLEFMRLQSTQGSVLAAVAGVSGLWLTGHLHAEVSWYAAVLSYWMVETTGALLFAPVAWDLTQPGCASPGAGYFSRLRRVLVLEWRFALAVLALTGLVIALLPAGQANYARAVLYGLLPLLVVVALQAQPLLVHLLILASGFLVLVGVAYLQRFAGDAADSTELLLVALYLLVGTAALDVLLATTAEKRAALERLERQAFVDAQTGLLNEAGVMRVLEDRGLAGAPPAEGSEVALISVTLSNARQAASLTGTPALAELDRQMASQLHAAIGEVQWGRVAPSRFLGVWQGDPGALDALLSRIVVLGVPPKLDDMVPNSDLFRALWSVAAVTRDSSTLAQQPRQAMPMALALAETRAQQFRRVEVAPVDDRLLRQLQHDAAMVERVRAAIESRTLLLYAQPIVSNANGAWERWQAGDRRVRKFEVLVRMAAPDGEVLSPGVFMPAAMRAGLMPQLDMAVMEQTFAWLAAHPYVLEQVQGCAINLSGPTVGDAATLDYVRTLFQRYPVPPALMIFEITESLAATDPEVAAHTLQALRAMGSRVAIDDFGTGVATFDYLKRFAVDFIKIDGTFIGALEHGTLDRIIVESMVKVASHLGVATVAEYVATARLRELVTEMGIEFSQGFAVGEPQPMGFWLDKPPP